MWCALGQNCIQLGEIYVRERKLCSREGDLVSDNPLLGYAQAGPSARETLLRFRSCLPYQLPLWKRKKGCIIGKRNPSEAPPKSSGRSTTSVSQPIRGLAPSVWTQIWFCFALGMRGRWSCKISSHSLDIAPCMTFSPLTCSHRIALNFYYGNTSLSYLYKHIDTNHSACHSGALVNAL